MPNFENPFPQTTHLPVVKLLLTTHHFIKWEGQSQCSNMCKSLKVPQKKLTGRLELMPEAQRCKFINLPIFADTLNSSHPSKADYSRTFHCLGIYKYTGYPARQTFTVADETAPEAEADLFLKHCSQGGKQIDQKRPPTQLFNNSDRQVRKNWKSLPFPN
ncbi:Protein CBG11097 [Caenorhabditis briggsae]|uniref:Protein CBG11097 n=1 Tax=Caenorhabditis briggsae TaxID=6238 RepID=A8XCE4_CAEBR|nr:Protein CBG11097 [Caenorhabditis briggsae]CAP30311.2 Protein CBG11097 [Caenorhabditis briggsae]